MFQDHDELFKRCVEIVEMADNTKPDLDKSYFEYDLLFVCILFVVYKGQDYRTFRFDCMDMSVVVIGGLLLNFVSNGKYIDAIFLLGDEIFVIDKAFLQYIKEGGEFLI